MKQISGRLFLILLLATSAFPAVLTDDLQVVIPTGQPGPLETCVSLTHAELHAPSLIFRWDGSSTNIVMARDHFSTLYFQNVHGIQELQQLQKQLDMKFGMNMQIRNKAISIKVVLE